MNNESTWVTYFIATFIGGGNGCDCRDAGDGGEGCDCGDGGDGVGDGGGGSDWLNLFNW